MPPSPALVRVDRFDVPGLEHVAEIVLDRPEAMNAVSTEMARAIAAATERVAGDDTVRCVVLTSSHDRAFCVGADLKERNAFTDADLMEQRPVARAAYGGVLRAPDARDRCRRRLRAGRRLRARAVVRPRRRRRGRARGAARGERRGHPRRRRHPAARAPRRVVARVAADLHGRPARAAAALELGAVDEVVPAGTARARALELAATIAAHSPVGLRNAKRAMRLGADVDLATGLEVEDACWRATAFSGDRREGVAAFAEKRQPRWPGR